MGAPGTTTVGMTVQVTNFSTLELKIEPHVWITFGIQLPPFIYLAARTAITKCASGAPG